ncbi:MAG: amidohydrolase family protein, partial [Ktedonobacteraceae bacterium]
DATYEQAQEAIALGITHMTHCFNAMPSLLHRVPGPLAAIVNDARVQGELIADGIHVHPAVVCLLVKLLGPERTVVITDAQAGAGLENRTTFEFAGQIAHVLCGAAYLADGTLAGSVLTMQQALRNMLDITHVSLSEAVGMLTLNPARTAHAVSRKGRLQAGYDADLLIFDAELRLLATFCRGQLAYATETWKTLLQANDIA